MKRFSIISYLFLFVGLTLITSCGGGGGGGGGAAAGPSASAEDVSSSDSVSDSPSFASAPVLSAEAEILAFEFKKDSNEAAFEGDSTINTDNVSSDLVGIIDSANATVVVKYPFDTLTDKSALIPEISVSANASVSPESGAAQDFSVPVTYSVTAQNGAVKRWTVSFEQLVAGEHNIAYHIEGDTSGFRHSFNEGETVTLAVRREVTKQNYCFAGWYEDENCTGSPIEGWYPHEKTAGVELWPKWLPAPRVDTSNHTVYTNGLSVIVKDSGMGTSIYYDVNNDGAFDSGDVNLSDIDPVHTPDFTKWNIKVSTHPNTNYPPLPNAKIAITGGMLNNVEASATTNVLLSGNPIVGDKNQHGIRLATCPGNVVKIKDDINTLSGNITLIAAGSLSDGDAVAKSEGGNYANADKFVLRNKDCNDFYDINVLNSDVVVFGTVGLPNEPYTQGLDENGSFFTLGGGHVSAKGTIFSVFVDGTNAFFILPSTTIEGGTFDMAVPYDAGGAVNYVENASEINGKKLQYVQFKSEAGNLSPKKVSEYFGNIKFYGTNVRVSINLQTVPFTAISGYTYFNGSFYKIIKKNAQISWTEAYNDAKTQDFDGLNGYLVTITSSVENRFIYDRLLKKDSYYGSVEPQLATTWLGGTISGNDWIWACGPEEGKKFYTGRTWTGRFQIEKGTVVKTNQRVSGMFASWDNDEERALNHLGFAMKNGKAAHWTEPNNGETELYCQYSGLYVWNNLKDKPGGDKNPKSYIVEFTAYDQHIPNHPALKADRSYSNSSASVK